MSEFSMTVHFYGTSPVAVAEALSRSKISAWVLGGNERTTSIAVGYEQIEEAMGAVAAPCVFFEYAEDHGLRCHFRHRGELIAQLEYAMEEDEEDVPEEYRDPAPIITERTGELASGAGFVDASGGKALQKWADCFDIADWDTKDDRVDELGQLLGLFAFRSISARYVTADEEPYRDEYPELIRTQG